MIRTMQACDLEAVADLERACFSEPWSYRILEAGIHSPYDIYYVFEQDGRILGYANLRILAGEGEIQRIAVDPNSRRLGIGRELMEAMEAHAICEQASVLSLEVRAGNTPARNLYESQGFVAEAVRKGYYHNPPEDAVVMWKRNF